MRLTGPESFYEAKEFLWNLYEWLEEGVPTLPEPSNAAERFALLWQEHQEVHDTVARFIFACLNPHEEAVVDLSRKTQRQLFVRVLSALPLVYDPKLLNTKLVSVVLAGEQRSQTIVNLVLCRLWEADTWPRLCLARYADEAGRAEDLERCRVLREEWLEARERMARPTEARSAEENAAAAQLKKGVETEAGESVIRVFWRTNQERTLRRGE